MASHFMDDEGPSDIGALWEQALHKYHQDTGINIKGLPQRTWNVSTIMNEQERQVKEFSNFRHNKGVVDKLRSAISRNSDIIQAVAQHVADAASASFPPSAAIMTAFTFIMRASKNISEDYDLIVSFFDLMNSFLERVSLLETKMPTAKTYERILMRVFSSLMVLCGIATREIANGRFKKWFKALYKGTDDELKSSYDTLEKNIQRLESATMFATLATAIETKADVKELGVTLQQTLNGVTETLTVTTETKVMVKEIEMAQDEHMGMTKQILKYVKNQDRRREGEGNKIGGKSKMDSGAKKSEFFKLVKNAFSNSAEPLIQFREIQNAVVKDTFKWLDGEESYKSFIDGDAPLLWVYGQAGMGKSCLAYSIVEKLRDSFGNEPRTTVSYFFFKEEHEELRSIKNMLSSAVIGIATDDSKYREEAAADLKRDGRDFDDDDGSQIWARFFASKFPRDSEAKLLLVLDGIDEADEDGRAKLLEFLQQVSKDDLNIQVVLTSRPHLDDTFEILKPAKIEITKAKLSQKSGDLWRIIMARCKTQAKLRRLKSPVWKKIAVKLRHKADSILYVEQMLRRLNGIGRESLIMKELDILPDSLKALYSLMLSECQSNRTREQLATLKKLFAWLAYSKRPLTLGEATSLVATVVQNKSFSLEEEIDGRSARILQLTTTNVADEDVTSDDTDSELNEKHEEEISPSRTDDSALFPLKFQERSLRQYFREMDADETGLRSSPSSAHLTIFEMAARVLNTSANGEDDEEGGHNEFVWQLQEYSAKFWIQHFLDIDPSTASEQDTKLVVERLHMIMNPRGKALENIENFQYQSHDLFGGAVDIREGFFNSLQKWSESAIRLPSGTLSDEHLTWIKESSSSPKQTMVHLARGHVVNWFKAENPWSAQDSFLFAQNALRMTDFVSGLSKEPSDDPPTEADILVIADIFEDITKTASAYMGIAFAMSDVTVNLWEPSLVQMKKSLDSCTSDMDRFKALYFTARIEMNYINYPEFTGNKDEHIQKAYEEVTAALAVGLPIVKDAKIKKDAMVRDMVLRAITLRGRCEVVLGKLDSALVSAEEARALFVEEHAIGREFIEDVTAALEKQEEYGKIIFIVEKFNKYDLLVWLGFSTSVVHERFQRACKECDNPTFMIQTYEKAIASVDAFNEGSESRLYLAKAHRRVFPNYSQAKLVLKEIIDGRKGAPPYLWADSDILEARLELTEILMEEFRASTDLKEKIVLGNELKRVVLQDRIAVAADFNPYESQTAISVALISSKLGPADEFQDGMEKIFGSCVDALSDTEGWNDRPAFRMLAKTLACIPGLEKDSQISISLQFSVVDKAVRVNTSPEISEDTLATVSEAVEEKTTAPVPKPEQLSEPISEPEPKLESEPEPEEDLDTDVSGIFCNGCSRTFENWSAGSVYLCIICTDCDLCEDCYKKRMASNHGEAWKEWKTFCGPDHHYIKGPIAEWKGVKDGVIRFGGVSIDFKDWLKGLKEKRWPEAWTSYWKMEGLVDVL